MNRTEHSLRQLLAIGFSLFLGGFFFTACQNDLRNLPGEQAFTREKLEKLGEMLRNELLEQYEILPEKTPYDTSVYWYTQTLYEQATSAMHLDKQSPIYNKWDQTRQWKVFIIKNDETHLAFTLPGGDFFITTAILKDLKNDYELYALLSFEATLMNDGLLLAQWTKAYNSLTINNLIEGNDQPNPLTADVLAQEMTSFIFDKKAVEAADEAAIENTCETSILSPVGLLPLISSTAFAESKWLQTRPSYDGRAEMLPNVAERQCQNNQLGNGNFQRFVLNILE